MISHEHKFLFIHIPKTAGNSIQNILVHHSENEVALEGKQDGVDRFGIRNLEHPWLKKHSTYRDYRKAYGAALDGYQVFAGIRNPFDKLVSAYFSPKGGREREFVFEDFAAFCRRIRTFQYFTARAFLTPKLYLPGRVDTLVRFEHLQDDFNRLMVSLGLTEEMLPVRNKSDRIPYRDCYDTKLRRFVEDRHAYEIQIGGYEF